MKKNSLGKKPALWKIQNYLIKEIIYILVSNKCDMDTDNSLADEKMGYLYITLKLVFEL